MNIDRPCRSSVHRRYYFAIPPNVFLETAASIKQVGLSTTGFTRLVVEKREWCPAIDLD